jgi:hypothetical protein
MEDSCLAMNGGAVETGAEVTTWGWEGLGIKGSLSQGAQTIQESPDGQQKVSWCSMAAVTKCHKLANSKQQLYSLTALWDRF